MTDHLDKAAAHVRTLPPERQDEIARMMFAFIDNHLSIHQPVAVGQDEAAAEAAASLPLNSASGDA